MRARSNVRSGAMRRISRSANVGRYGDRSRSWRCANGRGATVCSRARLMRAQACEGLENAQLIPPFHPEHRSSHARCLTEIVSRSGECGHLHFQIAAPVISRGARGETARARRPALPLCDRGRFESRRRVQKTEGLKRIRRMQRMQEPRQLSMKNGHCICWGVRRLEALSAHPQKTCKPSETRDRWFVPRSRRPERLQHPPNPLHPRTALRS